MVTLMIVVLNELPDGLFQLPRIVIVLQLYDVLHGTVITFNLALGLGMVRLASGVGHTVSGQVAREITGAIVTEQARFVFDLHLI